jgi:hypothetical protein
VWYDVVFEQMSRLTMSEWINTFLPALDTFRRFTSTTEWIFISFWEDFHTFIFIQLLWRDASNSMSWIQFLHFRFEKRSDQKERIAHILQLIMKYSQSQVEVLILSFWSVCVCQNVTTLTIENCTSFHSSGMFNMCSTSTFTRCKTRVHSNQLNRCVVESW